MRTKKVLLGVLLITVLFFVLPNIVFASVISDNFDSDTGLWEYSGSAYRDSENGYVVLTANQNYTNGHITLNRNISVPYTLGFWYKAGGSPGEGADGIWLYLDDEYFIEFDNHFNTEYPGEPSPNHIALGKGPGLGNHLISVDDSRTEDFQWHFVIVQVETDQVRLFVDGGLLFNWYGNVDPADATIKLYATSGATSNWQIVDDITVFFGSVTGFEALDKLIKLDPSLINPMSIEGDPIDCSTGAHVIDRSLLKVTGAETIDFKLQYNSLLLNEGPMGKGWSHNFETHLIPLANGDVDLYWSANRVNRFVDEGTETLKSYDRACKFDVLQKNADGSFTLTRKDHSVYEFNALGNLTEYKNGHGQSLTMSYNAYGNLERITEPVSQRWIMLHYDDFGLVEKVSDDSDRYVTFEYTNGCLTKTIDAEQQATTYTYNTNGQIESGTDHEGVCFFENCYDEEGRVISQDDARSDNELTRLYYDETVEAGKVYTTVYNRNGHKRVLVHDDNYQLLRIIDELGNQVVNNSYNEEGYLESSTDANGKTTSFKYDNRGNLLTSTDYLGRTSKMTYCPSDNLESVTNAVYNTVYYQYDDHNNVTSIIDSLENETKYTYYPETGLLWKMISPRQGITEYQYFNGQVSTVSNAVYNTVYYNYDDVGRLSSVSVAGKTTIYTYDNVDNLLSIQDPLQHFQSFTYDSQHNILTSTDAKNKTTYYQYNGNGKLIKLTDAKLQETIYEYDGEDNLKRAKDPRNKITTYNYDAKGRLVEVIDPLENKKTYEYDQLDRVVGEKDALNNKILTVTYDDTNGIVAVTDAVYRTVYKHYDELNRLDWTKDPMGRITRLEYDALNRVVLANDPTEGTAKQSFDKDGNLELIEDPNKNQTNFAYDLAGNITAKTNAAQSTLAYQYNTRGLLDKMMNGRGQEVSYEYYDDGRIRSFTDPTGTVTYTYDANGNLETVTDASGTTTRQYDELNRVVSYTDARGNNIGYHYDPAGNLDILTYPDEKQVRYSYDDANRLETVTDWNQRITTYQYYPNGKLHKVIRPNGTVLTYDYDAAGQLLKQTDVDANENIINQIEYTYYDDGNVKSEDSSITEQVYAEPVPVMTYAYDNRLNTFNGQVVSFDDDGNMTYGPLNGVMTNFTYDSRNRLTNAGDTAYSYDAENNRIKIMETVGGEVYENSFVVNTNTALSQVLVKTDEEGNQTYYVYGLGLIGEEDEQGNYKTYHFDRRGSTVALTDENGSVTDTFQYAPYGELVYRTGTTQTMFLYNGRDGVQTDNNGLNYMRARYYNLEIMRFVNRDVVQGGINGGQTLNRYAYVNGNPVSYVDPFGLCRDQDSIWEKIKSIPGGLVDIWGERRLIYQQTFLEAGVDPEISGQAFDLMFGYVTGELAASAISTGAKTVNGIRTSVTIEGASSTLKNLKGLDDFLNEPSKLKNVKPDELYNYLKNNGHNPQPLSGGSFKGVSFEDGGGFKVNWGGDRILQYHPAGKGHHGGFEYWKISSGPTGTIRYDMNGNIIK